MPFNSFQFIFIFFPITLLVFFFLLKCRLVIGAKWVLVLASLFFYTWINTAYLPLILFSVLFNYMVASLLNNNIYNIKVPKKTMLSIGVIVNLTLLAYFKYANFFIENFNKAFDVSIGLLHFGLPVAISFYTFQQIAYLVDSYHGETKKDNFLDYSIFVTFFPKLLAGPIVYHAEFMPQISSKWNLVKKYENFAMGLFLFLMGLFKKVVIADSFADLATAGFSKIEILSFFQAWITSSSYTFQIYFDFSGYTDMAIGAALFFNIKLPINFNSPYKAKNIQDFWRRWHISLSLFLKDYIYIPLGGNRKGNFRTYINLMVTFILAGLWHGAAWTFVFWGFLHGLALVIHRFWKQLGFTMNNVLAWVITFNFINVSWIFFRAENFDRGWSILKGMIGLNGIEFGQKILKTFAHEASYNGRTIQPIELLFWITGALLLVLFTPNLLQITSYIDSDSSIRFRAKWYYLLVVSLLGGYALAQMMLMNNTKFLYFNF